jgi:pimeloyl-ACP methyl ester carboxylesterase
MTLAARAARATLVGLSAAAPPVAAEVGYRLWRSVGRPEPVHPRDAAVHARAARGILDLDGTAVATYAWGDGPEVVLLVHGWRSRASRFGALVEALEGPGRTIVAFDAPGHGDTPGTRTSILEFARILRLLAARHGGATAIVAHSFGVLSAFLAAREGVAVDRIVGIAGIHDADEIVEQFCREAGLGARAQRGLRRRIEHRFFAGVPDIWRRFTAELDPTDTSTEVLLVHDRGDPRVGFRQSEQIRDAHTGPVRLVATEGLGHNRILGSAAVVDEVAAFLDGPRVQDRPYRTESRAL